MALLFWWDSIAKACGTAGEASIGPWYRSEAEALVSLWRAIREQHLATVTQEVEEILGQKPISFQQWVQQNAAAFR